MVKTKSSVFILPMILGVPTKYFSGFTNVFIGTSESGKILETNKRIFLVFKTEVIKKAFSPDEEGGVVENKSRIQVLKASNQYVNTLLVGDYTIYAFKPLEQFEKDYNKFKKGLYSKFSSKYKRLVNNFYGVPKLKRILHPTDTDREVLAKDLQADLPKDCEIFSSPDLIDEEFSYGKFLEVS